jgi:hypothetical protein
MGGCTVTDAVSSLFPRERGRGEGASFAWGCSLFYAIISPNGELLLASPKSNQKASPCRALFPFFERCAKEKREIARCARSRVRVGSWRFSCTSRTAQKTGALLRGGLLVRNVTRDTRSICAVGTKAHFFPSHWGRRAVDEGVCNPNLRRRDKTGVLKPLSPRERGRGEGAQSASAIPSPRRTFCASVTESHHKTLHTKTIQ